MKLLRTLIGSLLITLTACGTFHSEPVSGHTPSPNQAITATQPTATSQRMPPGSIPVEPLPAAVTKLPNIVCRKQHEGWVTECTSGDLDIHIYPDGCDEDGFYGKVRVYDAPSVTLWDSVPSPKALPVAKLKSGQLICSTGDAQHHDSTGKTWMYVTAIPAHTVKACIGKDWCDKPSDLPIEWMHAPSGIICHRDTSHHYVGDCPSGWVKASDIGEFSMGL